MQTAHLKNLNFFPASVWVLILFCFFQAYPGQVFGQTSPSSRQLPTSQNAKVGEQSDGARYISKSNVSKFASKLLQPLIQIVEDRRMAMSTLETLPFSWTYSREWSEATEENVNRFQIDDLNKVKVLSRRKEVQGFAFPMSVPASPVIDPSLRATMLMWNMQSLTAIGGNTLIMGKYLVYGSGTANVRKSDFAFLRVSDFGSKVDDVETGLLFREIFAFTGPSLLSGFSFLTTRYADFEEDKVKVYSPVLKSSRDVSGVNRSDSLLDGDLSVDDMFVFGAHPQGFSARVVDEKELWVPFLSTMRLSAEETTLNQQDILNISPSSSLRDRLGSKEDSAEGTLKALAMSVQAPFRRSDGSNVFFVPNSEGDTQPTFASWAPMTAQFALRKVWVIELYPRGPFHTYGKQLLFIDQDTAVPYYKLIFDRQGGFLRILLAGWGLAADKLEKHVVPVLGFILSVSSDGKKASLFQTEKYFFRLKGKVFSNKNLFSFPNKNPAQEDDSKKTSNEESDIPDESLSNE